MDYKSKIEEIMLIVEDLSQKLNTKNPIKHDDYEVKDLGCPHEWPKLLPTGYCAVYFFAYGSRVLKIGKANSKSKSRFTSQHYRFNALSTLAKSLYLDNDFNFKSKEDVKPWMLKNLQRINILIKEEDGNARTELMETVLHYHFRPKYEGAINLRNKKN